MPRKPRQMLWTEAACYHVMNRGHNRECIFDQDADRTYFLTLLDRYRLRFKARIYHYCLMSNHFHLLIQLDDPRVLSRFGAGLLLAYVRYRQQCYGFVGHLFQGRFKSPAVDAEPYLLSCGRYIERNPVEPGLVAEPWDYPWSSCRAYALGKADGLVSPNPYYEQLAKTPQRRQELWRAFLLGDDPKEAVIRKADWVLGDDQFRSKLQRPAARPMPRRRGRPAKRPN